MLNQLSAADLPLFIGLSQYHSFELFDDGKCFRVNVIKILVDQLPLCIVLESAVYVFDVKTLVGILIRTKRVLLREFHIHIIICY